MSGFVFIPEKEGYSHGEYVYENGAWMKRMYYTETMSRAGSEYMRCRVDVTSAWSE